MELGRIEVWAETYYPSWIPLGSAPAIHDEPDVRKAGLDEFGADQKRRAIQQARELRRRRAIAEGKEVDLSNAAQAALSADERKKQEERDSKVILRMMMMFMGAFTFIIFFFSWLMFVGLVSRQVP